MKVSNLLLNHKVKECGIVEVSFPALGLFLSSRSETAITGIHGIRKIKVLDILDIDKVRGIAFLLVWSKDVPAYVSFHKIMGSLRYTKYQNQELPILILAFQDVSYGQSNPI